MAVPHDEEPITMNLACGLELTLLIHNLTEIRDALDG